MKFDHLRSKKKPRLMIIPMIDIMFFLLVFFMMSTLYMVDQKVLPVALPQASSAQAVQNDPISITMTTEGMILVNSEQILPEALPKRIKNEMNHNPDAAFVLRADHQIEYGHVVWLMDELKKCGVRRVGMATELKP